jgi:hypothetical protein
VRDALRLIGYCYDVYARGVRMVLAAKGLEYDHAERHPF